MRGISDERAFWRRLCYALVFVAAALAGWLIG